MRKMWLATTLAVAAAVGLAAIAVRGRAGSDTVESHVAAATAAAGTEHRALLGLCDPPEPEPARHSSAAAPPPTPARSEWHADPVKVFDNLYFVGEKEFSAWAVTTPAGIIVVDTLWPYSVEDEIAGGLTTLGLDPSTIKYAIVSHAHADHAGGARYLQDHFSTRVIMSAADWDLLARDTSPWPKPKRDMTAVDGQKLSLGGTTVTLYITPGHTPGTISTLIPVNDHGTNHLAAEWGGTAFNFTITPERPARFWFETYIASAERFRDIVRKDGADIVISNHTELDGSTRKLASLANRKPGDPHPYVIGTASVVNYLTVADECAKAGLLRLLH